MLSGPEAHAGMIASTFSPPPQGRMKPSAWLERTPRCKEMNPKGGLALVPENLPFMNLPLLFLGVRG